MSYGFVNPCFDCVKAVQCIDRDIIQGAIYSIHSLNQFNRTLHPGAGSITLQCSNKVKLESDK
jgi:hypothetical protein